MKEQEEANTESRDVLVNVTLKIYQRSIPKHYTVLVPANGNAVKVCDGLHISLEKLGEK